MNLEITDLQTYLFHEGKYYEAYKTFGSHVKTVGKKVGIQFTVWAPHAKAVAIVGDFNNWNSTGFELKRLTNEGIWTGFFPSLTEGTIYKYEIKAADDRILLKADPFAIHAELKPNTASVVYDLKPFKWTDTKWFKAKQKKKVYNQPLNIYEVHLGSWKKKENGDFYTYEEYAEMLIEHVKEHQFTHVELLPLTEHPYDRSWGYQGTGYYAATSRFGTPADFRKFVNMLHNAGIGIIMDWVPGHFCKDAHGLYMFDGQPTFDYQTADTRENEVWGTANFDLGKPEVRSFLISCALFWLREYHIDGFRIDAVANMIYWTKDYKFQENPYAIQFLRELNEAVYAYDENTLMIAEDSTDFPLVTAPTYLGGLGFNYKWNMGWMNDVLSYMEESPFNRRDYHNKITFGMAYAYSENFVLPLSHDEVVHGKKSLLNKMPGSYEEKFQQLRLLLGFFYTHPGKKMMFMGGEIGQFDEWKDLEQIDWFLKGYDLHSKLNEYYKSLSGFYKKNKSLYELDHDFGGFQWIDVNNADQSVFSFIRKSEKEDDFVVVVLNFTGQSYQGYKVGVPAYKQYKEVFSSDEPKFGGYGMLNKKNMVAKEETYHGQPHVVSMDLPAYGFVMLKPVKSREGTKKDDKKKMRSNVTSRGTRK